MRAANFFTEFAKYSRAVIGSLLNIQQLSFARRLAFTACCLGALNGCSKQTGEVSPVNNNLAWLGRMYGMYAGQHGGNPPRNIDELRKYVERKTSPDELSRLGAASIDALFVSPRDGKPFQMVSYPKLPPLKGGESPPVVLHEQAGSDGKLAIVLLGGVTQTVDQSALQAMLPKRGG